MKVYEATALGSYDEYASGSSDNDIYIKFPYPTDTTLFKKLSTYGSLAYVMEWAAYNFNNPNHIRIYGEVEFGKVIENSQLGRKWIASPYYTASTFIDVYLYFP